MKKLHLMTRCLLRPTTCLQRPTMMPMEANDAMPTEANNAMPTEADNTPMEADNATPTEANNVTTANKTPTEATYMPTTKDNAAATTAMKLISAANEIMCTVLSCDMIKNAIANKMMTYNVQTTPTANNIGVNGIMPMEACPMLSNATRHAMDRETVPTIHTTPTEANTYDEATVPTMHDTPTEAETKIMNDPDHDDEAAMNSPAATAEELACKDKTEDWPPPKPPDMAQEVLEAEAAAEKTTTINTMMDMMTWQRTSAKKTTTLDTAAEKTKTTDDLATIHFQDATDAATTTT
eukprot:CAMPEP_0172519372 /NCGR_PEP_ID=MMETSP1066-20121228/291377_1 /TAXON_ID=671091 /ORGANISM="Coscinodiscus wailesii, Strain CCMP2513" /LENGTH=293 /DNA_ID=CAMNT_0013301945 /DNA_START=193 /DNA_END=1074 /DNA_ORIENTATION=-